MTIRVFCRVVAAVLLTACCFTTHAGFTRAQIDDILVWEQGNMIYVYPVGGVAGAPSCHGSNGNYYSFSMSRPMAKEYLASLMAAMLAGSSVEFWGAGACNDQSMSETLRYFRVSRP